MKKYAEHITPRSIKFSPIGFQDKYWHSQKPEPTYTFNTLAIYLPVLEKMVVLSLKKSLPMIQKPNLIQEVNSLIAQEAYHGSEYAKILPEMVYQYYPNLPQKYNFPIFRTLAAVLHIPFPNLHFALSAAGEHFTAISADLFLKNPDIFANVPEKYARIWRWHAIEEIEHKTVAFDVYQEISGNYIQRVFGMFIMTVVFMSFLLMPIFKMMKQDKNHLKFNRYKEILKYHWGKNGLWRGLIKPYFYYYHPKFHPAKIKNLHLIEFWKTKLDTMQTNDEKLQVLDLTKAP